MSIVDKRVRLLIRMYDRIRGDSRGKLSPGRTMHMVRGLAKIDTRIKEDWVVWDNFFIYTLHRLIGLREA